MNPLFIKINHKLLVRVRAINPINKSNKLDYNLVNKNC